MGKIIKDNQKEVASAFDFKVFKSVKQGINSFEVKTFSTVEKGIKNLKLNKLENKNKPVKEDKKPEPKLSNVNEKIIEEQAPVIDEKYLEKHKKQSFDEGYKQGYEAAKLELKKEYEAEKSDYLDKLDKFLEDAKLQLKEIEKTYLKFDKDIPELVIRFVKEIIGAERKINDELIVSIVKSQIERLKELEDITFIINPEDEEIFQKNFTFYHFEKDPSVLKGGVIIKTKIGEVEISIDKLIDDFVCLIHEKLGLS